jgi:hypothetical membrane protein
MTLSNTTKAGAAVFVGAVQFGIAVILAEALYPGYSISKNAISDLGAACTPAYVCTVSQPSSNIFSLSLVILGLLLLLSSYFFSKGHLWRPLVVSVALAGFGTVGVGLLPESAGAIHGVVSLIAFLFSGIAAVLSFKVLESPFRYLSAVLGVVSLAAIVLFLSQTYLGLGLGGMERMIAYPALFWYLGLGGQLMGKEDLP